MAVYVVTIRVSSLVTNLCRSLQRTRDLVAFGLNQTRAAGNAEPGESARIPLPGVVLDVVFAQDTAPDVGDVQQEFEAWVLTNGLRDCAEALGPLLEEARVICTLACLGPQIRAEDWKDKVIDGRDKFDKMHLPDKITHLAQLGGPSIIPPTMDHIFTINLARNCLVHRHGVVSARDLNEGDSLVVKWLNQSLTVTGVGGERTVSALPFEMDAGETLSLRTPEVRKVFHLGEHIGFTAEEFRGICWTFLLFAQQLAQNLESLLATKGIVTVDSTGEQAEITTEP